MKKVLFLAVAALCFAACGNTNNKKANEAEAVVEETVVEEVKACDSDCANCDSTCTKECAADTTKCCAK